MFMFRLIVMMI